MPALSSRRARLRARPELGVDGISDLAQRDIASARAEAAGPEIRHVLDVEALLSRVADDGPSCPRALLDRELAVELC